MTELISEHDVVAIGCGPFNLGLAALASTADGLDLVVLEEQSSTPPTWWWPRPATETARPRY